MLSRRRVLLLRAIAAFLALPGLVAGAVPLLIALPLIRGGQPFRLVALVPLLLGLALLLWCARVFLVLGRGTLAPWDPPRALVTGGPYRVTRNPMYVAVALMLLGWAIGFASWGLLVYAGVVVIAFHLRVLAEERTLAENYREPWKKYSAQVPRWVFRSWFGVAFSCVGLVAMVLFAGLIYEAYADASAARNYPPPGTLVDIGGRRFHLLCIGNGEPTVLFEGSGFGNATSGARARERIARRTRVCSYDRSGMGWSDPGPASTSPVDLARDLAVLQDQQKLGSRMVVVASSIGGLTAEMFARQYPERIAGLVLLDAATSEVLPYAAPHLGTAKTAACAAGLSARFGLIRLLDPFELARDDSDEARRAAAVTYGPRPWGAVCGILRGLASDPDVFAKAPPQAAELPVTVLSASSDEGIFPGSRWFSADLAAQRVPSHQRFAKRSSRATWKLVPKSTHLIAGSNPALVADEVLSMLEENESAPSVGLASLTSQE